MVKIFEVIVRGHVSADLADALDGFAVTARPGGVTSIIGPIVDQPRLLGLLGAFDDLHIEVVSVNPIAGAGEKSPDAGDAAESPAH